MCNKKISLFIALLVVIVASIGIISLPAQAVDLDATLQSAGEGIYGEGGAPSGDSLPATLGRVIRVVLSMVGIMLVIIVIYAGFLWMTAGGNEDQVKKAKSWLGNAVIGLLITLSAYAITAFVVTRIGGAALGGDAPAGDDTGAIMIINKV